MPEAVALAEILCDLDWRRHVAMANDYDLMQFYRLVARRLGQPTKFSDRLAYSYRIDPLKSWVIEYRKQFRTIRDQHWRRVRTHHPSNPRFPYAILPTIRHFKGSSGIRVHRSVGRGCRSAAVSGFGSG
jgi:hypothetical protein